MVNHRNLITILFFLFLFMLQACSPKVVTTETRSEAGDSLTRTSPAPPAEKDAVEPDYFKPGYMRYDNHIYSGNIRTIQFYREGWEFAIPLITFGSDEKLLLSFDDLDSGIKSYKYTLIHCSAAWVPSDLVPAEYLGGLTEDFVRNYEFSFNTIQSYTHYSLSIPGDDVRPLLSGNYIIAVFLDDAEKTLVFTRRMMIVEPKVSVAMQVKRATSIEYKDYKQEVDFTINTADYRISNPYEDMKVILMQNNRWDNAKYDLKPRFVKGSLFDFDYEDVNVFSGGNEFRNFDIKSLKWNSERIARHYRDSAGSHVVLKDDERVTFKNYYSVKDINGNFLIRSEDNVRNGDIEAEYVWVHFFLRYNAPLIDGSIYVFGGLSDWQFLKEFQMKYNYERKGYECALYVKQGYYNFQYVFLENGSSIGDESFIEGMHFETENQYTVFVYARETGTLYDKLIAVQMVNTYGGK